MNRSGDHQHIQIDRRALRLPVAARAGLTEPVGNGPRASSHARHGVPAERQPYLGPDGVWRLPLTKGYEALIDEDVAIWAGQYLWRAEPHANGSTPYAVRLVGPKSDRRRQYLHRVVAGALVEEKIDHADRNSLNNRRANLRRASRSQNCSNAVYPVSVTGYRGVFRKTRRGVDVGFIARLQLNGRRFERGEYRDLLKAARAYDAMAREHHKEFAVLNFPDEAPK